jgi:hypothetical protein
MLLRRGTEMLQLKGLASAIRLMLAVAFATLAAACGASPDAVDVISIFEATPHPPPSFGPPIPGNPGDPHPDPIQEVFSPGDEMFLGLVVGSQLKKNVTFSKYTFYSRGTGGETEIGSASDRGPFDPGSIRLVAFQQPWVVPDQPGIYEVRVYLEDEAVASAVFEVR